MDNAPVNKLDGLSSPLEQILKKETHTTYVCVYLLPNDASALIKNESTHDKQARHPSFYPLGLIDRLDNISPRAQHPIRSLFIKTCSNDR